MKQFNEDNLDLLQNIEFIIVKVFRADPTLLDMDVKDAVDGLVRHYHAEEEQRTFPNQRLADRAERVFRALQELCEFRLGRAPLPGLNEKSKAEVPIAVLVKGLREIQKSIPRWTKQGGRKGYLEFVSRFV